MTYTDNSDTMNESDLPSESYADSQATFGDRLTLAREAFGLSPEQLAWRIGVRRSTITSWEDDRAEPRANRMQTLSGVLNVSLVWLMTGEGTGPVAAPEATHSTEADAILVELAALRDEQRRLAERMARFKSRLRAALAL